MNRLKISILKRKDVREFSVLARRIILNTRYYSKYARKNEARLFEPANLQRRLKDREHVFVVGRYGPKIVAFSSGHYDGESGLFYLDWLGVSDRFRRKGAALQLMEFWISYLKRNGIHKLWFDSRTNNKEAVALYKKHGYKIAAKLKRHWYGQDFFIWYKFLE